MCTKAASSRRHTDTRYKNTSHMDETKTMIFKLNEPSPTRYEKRNREAAEVVVSKDNKRGRWNTDNCPSVKTQTLSYIGFMMCVEHPH